MRWLALLAAWLLAVSPAEAQPTLTGAGGSVVVAAASYTGPGDIVSGAKVFLSCARAYTSAYASGGGKLCNIRRASDNETCDFTAQTSGGSKGLIGNSSSCSGADNGVSLTSFCNATTCFVTKAYDQSGALACSSAACDVAQATTANQPTVTVSCQNSLPCINDSGASVLLVSSGTVSFSNPSTFSVVAQRSSGTGGAGIFDMGIASQNNLTAANGLGNNFNAFAGSNASFAATDGAWHSAQVVWNAASTTWSVDGSAPSTINPGSSGQSGTIQIAWNGNNGKLLEAADWNSAVSSGNQSSLCHNENVAYSLGLSC